MLCLKTRPTDTKVLNIKKNMEVSKVNMTTYDELTKLSFVVSLTNALVALLLSQKSGGPPNPSHKNASSLSKKTHPGKLFTATLNSTPQNFSKQKSPRRHESDPSFKTSLAHLVFQRSRQFPCFRDMLWNLRSKGGWLEVVFGCWRCLLKKTPYQKRPP